MKRIVPFLLGILFLLPLGNRVSAQALCGFDAIHQQRMLNDPQYRSAVNAADQAWADYQDINSHTGNRILVENGDTIFEIPVVVHICNTGGAIGSAYNPSDQQIEDWINYTNQVYAATYPPYPQAGNGGVKLPVRFALAQRDPNCNPTNGILRHDMSNNSAYVNNGLNSGGGSGVSTTALTNVSQWPTNEYYNIYVVNKIDGNDGTTPGVAFTAGFAFLGMSTFLPADDGAYMLASVSHTGETTLPHEIGHALGLYHPFEGGGQGQCPPNNNCNNDNDKVCDTDPTQALLGTCPPATATNPCTGMAYGQNGVQRNFMNYSQCPDHFTQGQADRMMFALETYRPELISSMNSVPPPTSGGNTTPIAANCNPTGSQTSFGNQGFNYGPANIVLNDLQYFGTGYTNNSIPPDNTYYIDHTDAGACALPAHTYLTAGSTYQLSVSTLGSTQNIRVYIDYNNDGSFNDGDELVLDLSNAPAGNHNQNITIPATAVQDVPLRMRVMANANALPAQGCGNIGFGQAEDFAVTVLDPSTQPPVPCTPPNATSFVVSNVTTTSADINWDNTNPIPGDGYDYYLSTNGTAPSFATTPTGNTFNNFVNLTGLDINTTYHFWVRSNCNSSSASDWVPNLTFTTGCNPITVNLGPSQGICGGDEITLDAGNPGMSYSWSTGETTQTIEVTSPGTYSVAVTDDNGCQGFASIQITSDNPPTIDGINSTDNGSGSFTFEVVGGQNINHYDWDFDDGTTSTDPNPTHVFAQPGTYMVTLTYSNDCSSNQEIIPAYYNVVGIHEVDPNNDLIILYPNPAQNHINIQDNGNLNMNNLVIYNILGQKVYQTSLKGMNNASIDVSQFATGIYNVKIILENGNWTLRKFEVRH